MQLFSRQLPGALGPARVLLLPSLKIYEQLWLGHEFTLTRLTRNVDLEDAVFSALKRGLGSYSLLLYLEQSS